jgi:hypothetical protein
MAKTKAKPQKYLIETSAVRAALRQSTADQNGHLEEEVKDGILWTSLYIRMEFIRRWFCDTARVAFTIDMYTNVDDALIFLEQDFGIRNVKGYLAALAIFLRDRGVIRNARRSAEEIASLAIRLVEQFDDVFGKRIPNTCGCQIGAMTLTDIDYNNVLSQLYRFHESFKTPVQDCEVNDFLGFDEKKGRTAKLLGNAQVAKLNIGQNLASLRRDSTWITCTQCTRIGDAIISLEQPSSWCLVHVDQSFNILTECLDRSHKQIKSVKSLHNERMMNDS